MAEVIDNLCDASLSYVTIRQGDFVRLKSRQNFCQFLGRACQVYPGELKLIDVEDGNRITDIVFSSGQIDRDHPLRREFEILEVIPSDDVTIILGRRDS